MRTVRSALALALLGLSALMLGACASSPPATPATAAGPPSTAASTTESVPGATAIGPPQVAWADMTFDQRKAYMKTAVLPKAKELFVTFDPVHYANFNCATCHGDGATDGKFKMPNPKLPKLPTTPEGFKQLMADKPKVTEFMMKQVKPTMATLLGLPEFTPENKTGFGCMACHVMQ
jgi:hypothetical protein